MRVIVGLSGGVDSSVAAYLLKEKGYEVIGVTMKIWNPDNMRNREGCGSLAAIEDARRVAKALGIRHEVIDFEDIFKEKVVDYFIDEYTKACTPNPCIMCNANVKWGALFKAKELFEADYVATGHYARIEEIDVNNKKRYSIRNAVTASKDQTYALYRLSQEQLAHTLMPVGDYTKEEIRKIASDIGLFLADKPDSQDICFIEDNDYAGFIKNETGITYPKGNFVDKTGKVLGQHKGIIHYTIGQRKGLGIAMGEPVFVSCIDKERNEVVLGSNEDIMSLSLKADRVNYMSEEIFIGDKKYVAKIRYNHKGTPCRVKSDGEQIIVDFDEPVRAITKGQSVVIYDGDLVAGGGIIIG